MTPTPPDRARFEQLFDRHHRAVLGYALRRSGGPHDAADVVADTFLVAWRRLDDVPLGNDALPWLFGVARRVLANHRRSEQRRGDLAARMGEQLAAQLASTPLTPSQPHGAIGPALAQLSSDDREILLLSAWEGLQPAEIAAVMGLRGATARSRLRRARGRLERVLADQTPSAPPHHDAIQEVVR